MGLLSKQKYFRIISFLLIITTYLPVLTKNLPPVIRSHHLWAVIWVVSLITMNLQMFKNKFLLYVVLFNIVFSLFMYVNFWLGIDEWTLKSLRLDMYYFTIAITLLSYYKDTGDYRGLAQTAKWTMIFIGITSIMSIYSSYIDPLYARKITGGVFESSEDIFRYGGGAYGFAAGLVCLFPIMIYYYRNNSICIFSRTEILIFGVICFIALVRIQIFANIIVAILVIIISLSGRRKIRQSLSISAIILIIIIAIPRETKADFLKYISNNVNSESENKQKLDDLINYLSYEKQETMTESRIARYGILWDAFRENPLLGYFLTENDKKITEGGHLYFMYRVTAFGIIYFILFALIFVKYIKLNMELFNESYSFYFLLSVLSIIVLGLIKNLAGRELWYIYFFILPALYYLPIINKRIITED